MEYRVRYRYLVEDGADVDDAAEEILSQFEEAVPFWGPVVSHDRREIVVTFSTDDEDVFAVLDRLYRPREIDGRQVVPIGIEVGPASEEDGE